MKVLVTGGAGYIGSHCSQRLIRADHDVVIVDNLDRGHRESIERIRDAHSVDESRLAFHEGDIADSALLKRVLSGGGFDAVMHFAALAYVRESVERPLDYYRCNSAASLALIEASIAAGVPRFVFSSTCATYGEPAPELIPIREDCPQQPINPYGWSKLLIERMLIDAQRALIRDGRAAPGVAMLRYFNVAGCDRSGLLGEHHEPETHLIPIVLQVAMGRRDHVSVFGEDFPTPDGTAVRDYIHVDDLVDAHVAVLDALEPGGCSQYNIGLGRGYSVRQIIEAVQRVTGQPIPTQSAPRHPGDPPTLFCDAGRIAGELGWSAQVTQLEEIITTAWDWFRAHPNGYSGS